MPDSGTVSPSDEMRAAGVLDSAGNAYGRGCVGSLAALGAVRLPG